MKKNYIAPVVTSNGDAVQETKTEHAVLAKSLPSPESPTHLSISANVGFYL